MILPSFLTTLCLICLSFSLALKEYPTPAPTFEAKDYTKWSKISQVGKSRRAEIQIDFQAADGSNDYIHLYRVDLVGTAYDRGYAQGFLLFKEIMDFTGPKLNEFYRNMVKNIDISEFPEKIQPVLKALKAAGTIAAPKLFETAMAWVWENEKQYVPQYYFDEIKGMAAGICGALKNDCCDPVEWESKIQAFNMLPELIRMACTAYGAWGNATPEGTGLIQLRALDFGEGPFANYTVIATHRGSEFPNAYTTVSFPGFVGVVTGISQNGIGISQKVWTTNNKHSFQKGSYDGEPDSFVLRDLLQTPKNRAEAEAYVQNVRRTWGIWIGVGDYESQKFDLIAYRQADVSFYNDKTAPTQTGQPYIENVCYVDKHPQPSSEGLEGTLPKAIQDFWGNITLETTKSIAHAHGTGDLHIAVYDYNARVMNVAIGRINGDGKYGAEGGSEWRAHNRPYVKFNLDDLWNGL